MIRDRKEGKWWQRREHIRNPGTYAVRRTHAHNHPFTDACFSHLGSLQHRQRCQLAPVRVHTAIVVVGSHSREMGGVLRNVRQRGLGCQLQHKTRGKENRGYGFIRKRMILFVFLSLPLAQPTANKSKPTPCSHPSPSAPSPMVLGAPMP